MRGLSLISMGVALFLPLSQAYAQQTPTIGPPAGAGPLPRVAGSPYFSGGGECSRCCASPDWVLVDKFKGPDLPSRTPSLQEWYIDTFFKNFIHPALKSLGTEIVANVTAQTASLATFADAQAQIKTVRALQTGQARAVKSFTPSEELCSFGTLSGNLAFTDLGSRQIQITLSDRALDRQLMRDGTASAIQKEKGVLAGRAGDLNARFAQFRKSFCDPSTNNTGMKDICANSDKNRMNADIDFTRTIAQRTNLDINPLAHAGALTPDFESLQALQKNLYAHVLPESMPSPDVGTDANDKALNRLSLQNYRSMVARRSVAQNSFAVMAGMKTSGLPNTGDFLQAALKQLGLPDEEAQQMASDAPSYEAQMDVLTKRLYQSPSFYVGLMDKPDNINRQSTAMRAIELMQQRDIASALTRSEILMAMILEMKLEDAQRKLAGEAARQ